MICSNGFQFMFNISGKDSDVLGYVVPIWMEHVPFTFDPTKTTIHLPFTKSETSKEVSKQLHGIKFETLMFLHNVQDIEVVDQTNNSSVRYMCHKNHPNYTIEIHRKGLPVEQHRYKLYNADINMSHVKDSDRNGVTVTHVTLAFPLGTRDRQQVFAFLPVKTYNFKFIIQADFILPTNREDIHNNREWNKVIRDSIPGIFIQSLNLFKQDKELSTQWYGYIPKESEISDEFFAGIVRKLHQLLIGNNCILTDTNQWAKPNSVILASNKIRKLIPNEYLKRYLGMEYVHSDLECWKDELVSILRVRQFDFELLIKYLNKTEFILTCSDEWFKLLYDYILECDLNQKRIAELKSLPIILLEKDEVATLDDEIIFFPLTSSGAGYSFEKGMNIISRASFDPGHLGLLKLLGVLDPSPVTIVLEYILPTYENNTKIYLEHNLEHLRYILEHRWDFKSDDWEKVKENIWLVTDSFKIIKPSNIDMYIPKEYFIEDPDVPDLKPLLPGVPFVSTRYLEDTVPMEYAQKVHRTNDWQQLLVSLGALECPSVDKEKNTLSKTAARKQNLGHFPGVITDYVPSEDMKKLLQQSDPNLQLQALQFIALYSKEFEKKLFQRLKSEDRRIHATAANLRIPSKFLRKLRKMIVTASNRVVLPLSETFAKPRDTEADKWPFIILESPLSDPIMEAIGIQYESGSATFVLKQLIQLKAQKMDFHKKIEQLRILFRQLQVHPTYQDYEPIEETDRFEVVIFMKYEKTRKSLESVFKQNELILTKSGWKTSSHCYWAQSIDTRASDDLSTIYGKDFETFFTKVLKVPHEEQIEELGEHLVRLCQNYKFNEDRIKEIYFRMNKYLKPTVGQEVECQWITDVMKKNVILTNNGLHSSYSTIYFNDNDDIFEAYRTTNTLFLKVDQHELGQLEHFLQFTGIKSVEQATEAKINPVDHVENWRLTKLLRSIMPYVQRYLYNKDRDAYTNARVLFGKLQTDLRVFHAKKITCSYNLGTVKKQRQVDHSIDKQKLWLYSRTLNEDDLVSLIVPLFQTKQDLASFMTLMKGRRTAERESYMNHHRFKQMPEDQQIPVLIEEPEDELADSEPIVPVTTGKNVVEEKPTTNNPSNVAISNIISPDEYRSGNTTTSKNAPLRGEMKKPDESIGSTYTVGLLSQNQSSLSNRAPTIDSNEKLPRNDGRYKIEFDSPLLSVSNINQMNVKFHDLNSAKSKTFPTITETMHPFDQEASRIADRIDAIGMHILMLYEENRVQQYNSNLCRFDPKLNKDQLYARVFDVSTLEKIIFIRQYSKAGSKALQELELKHQLNSKSLGFDVLTLNANGDIDRLIELKSSAGMKRIVELSNNQWTTANKKILKKKYYLCFIGNIGSKPVGFIVENPSQKKAIPLPSYIVNLGDYDNIESMNIDKINIEQIQ
jgi:hypothetical protein